MYSDIFPLFFIIHLLYKNYPLRVQFKLTTSVDYYSHETRKNCFVAVSLPFVSFIGGCIVVTL